MTGNNSSLRNKPLLDTGEDQVLVIDIVAYLST